MDLCCDQGLLLLLKLSSQLPRLGKSLARVHYAVWFLSERRIYPKLISCQCNVLNRCLVVHDNTHHDLAPIELLLGLGEPLLQTLQFCSSVGLGTIRSVVYITSFGIVVFHDM